MSQMERTLSIIKPDATRRNLTGRINTMIEAIGLKIVAQKKLLLTKEQSQAFYSVHEECSFFEELCSSMTSDPVIVQVLEGNNAVVAYRTLMGATNPAHAEDGTIRKLFSESIEANSVHGSDSLENAKNEISFFFSAIEIVG